MQGPSNKIGAIAKDAVKAIAKFNHEGTYQILHDFASEVRRSWGSNRSYSSFYKDVLISMVKINPADSKDFILGELQNANSIPDSNQIKGYMVSALTQLPDPEAVKHVFDRVLFDGSHNVDFKKEAISKLDDEKLTLLRVAVESVKKIINDYDKNFVLFNYCYKKIFENGFTNEASVKDLIYESCRNVDFQNDMVSILSENMNKEGVVLDGSLIFKVLSCVGEKNYESLRFALCLKHNLVDTEKQFLESGRLLRRNIASTQKSLDHIVNIIKLKEEYPIPGDLSKNLLNLKNYIDDENIQNIKLLYGGSEIEKISLLKSALFGKSRSLVVVNVENLLESSSAVDKLESNLIDIKNKTLYFTNILPLIQEITSSDEKNRKLSKIISLMQKFTSRFKVQTFASMSVLKANLKENHPEFKVYMEEETPGVFDTGIEFKDPVRQKKKDILKYAKEQLDPGRKYHLDKLDEVLEVTEKYSLLEYIFYINEYFRNSLLAFGEIISMDQYNALNESLKVRVSNN